MHECCIREGDLHRLAKKTDEVAATELRRVFAEDVLLLETAFWEAVDKDSETPLLLLQDLPAAATAAASSGNAQKPTGSFGKPLRFVIDQCFLLTIPTMSNLLFLGLCNRSRAGPRHQS
jgi:hypothetical protein